MKILSLHIYHDMSLSFYDSESLFFQYVKVERLLGKKHFGLSVKIADDNLLCENYSNRINELIKSLGFTNPDIISIIDNEYWFRSSFYSNNDYEFVIDYKKNIKDYSVIKFIDSLGIKIKNILFMGHHYAHVLSGFPILNHKKCKYGACIDGQGNNITVSFFENPFDVINHKRYFFLEKELTSSIGHSFNLIGKKMNLSGSSLDFSGKVMGAQSYGSVDFDYINNLNIDKISENFYKFTNELVKKHNSDFFVFENLEFRNFLSTWHKIAEKCILNLFNKNINDKNEMIAYAGGVVQNTVINESLNEDYPNIFFIPHGYDGGLSLGGLYAICNYLKIELPYVKSFPYLQIDEINEHPSEHTIKIAAKLIADGMIVGWHQGAGEIGPRSLGNRSILMHPGIKNGKEILNKRVKKRENWRPYASSVLIEHAHDWFEFNGESPYMMRAIKTKEDKKHKIQSVVHEDGTCRIQTVSKSNNSFFYILIYEFYKLTGIPLILNTSLNVAGNPISSSVEDSKILFYSSDIDFLIIGDKIYNKKKKVFL